SHATTRNKGKEIAKPITTPSELASKEDSDLEQAQGDKDMQKKLALNAKYFKKIYKPTNNNLRTSSNSRNKNVDTTPRYMNDNQYAQFGNQRTMTVVTARENVGSPLVQQTGIQCFNCKEFGHFSMKCRKPKRVKDSTYHKEKILMCKQAEQGVPLQVEQSDWLADTDEEIGEQELEAHYSYMEKIQENDQNAVECDDEHVTLANLMANLKLDVDENKKIQKQLKKANASLTQELTDANSSAGATHQLAVAKYTSSGNLSSLAVKKCTSSGNSFALTEEVYVVQPDGFVDPDHPGKVYRLRKALYGLKQAPKAWYDELSQFLMSKGFTKGLQINKSPRVIFINQANYALEILKKHGMEKEQSIGTPMATKPKLDADLSGKLVDQTDYRSKIGSLMYLKSSRPDIVQKVCYCARYQARPTEKYLKEVKRILRYLRGTIDMCIWYPKDSGFELTAFSDVDHAGCIDTRKSTYGGIQFLGDKLVSWMSKKQDCTAKSSAEAEYVVLSASCAQVMWMRIQLKAYGFNYNKIPLYCNSQSAIAISCNPVQHSRTKYIHTRYHFIKKHVKNDIIELYFVRTEYQLADMFTKALPEDRFKYLVRRIGMRCLTPVELEVLANESA
nr:retrovirus-related Pol polyprotein from transposon TNT 1-94 [Tanacetum cinerariifolium]